MSNFPIVIITGFFIDMHVYWLGNTQYEGTAVCISFQLLKYII